MTAEVLLRIACAHARGFLGGVEKGRGTIIRVTRLTETSLITHWMTDTLGLLKTVAKGARRPKSAFRGKLDLFVDAELVWAPSRTSELHALREVDVRTYRTKLREDYRKTVLASYFGQLLEHVLEREHPEPEVADLLARALDYLETAPARREVLLRFERRLADQLGIGNEGRNAAAALESAFGRVPRERTACLSLLGDRGELH